MRTNSVDTTLAPCDDRTIAAWQNHRVEQGFCAYLYNWGWYQLEGFMPKLPLETLANQAADFHRYRIRGLYRCGFGELFGLEGPAYYIWGRLLENPARSRDQLLAEYCRHGFGAAAPEMEAFYRLLEERMKFDLPAASRQAEWYRPELLSDRTPALIETMRLMAMRYPADVTARLEALLCRAEAKHSGGLLALARREFDYLKLTVGVTMAFDRLRQSLSQADYQDLLAALAARNQWIARLPRKPDVKTSQIGQQGEFSLFGSPPVEHLQQGGRLLGRLRAPFNWDIDWLRANRIQPVNRRITSGEPAQMLVQINFDVIRPEISSQPTLIECRWDRQNLYLIFIGRNTSQERLAGDEFQAIVGYGGKRWWITGRPDRGITSFGERERTNQETGGDGDRYRLLRPSPARISVPAPGTADPSAMLTVPWSAFGLTPAPGMKLELNMVRFGSGRYVWEYNLDQKSYRNFKDRTGILTLK